MRGFSEFDDFQLVCVQLQIVGFHTFGDFCNACSELDSGARCLVHEGEYELHVSDVGEDIDVVRVDDASQRDQVNVEDGWAQGGALWDFADEVTGL